MFLGSSPRMRGTPASAGVGDLPYGLIPTYAGNTTIPGWKVVRSGAHPHVCGEHLKALKKTANSTGSSPRMRGTHHMVCVALQGRGLIPTCVGSTSLVANARAIASAHPHVCGEHFTSPSTVSTESGSSPRVWGALHQPIHREHRKRLIPTCVGSTLCCVGWYYGYSAHPHVCGEHLSKEILHHSISGSSPRVWGALAV